MAMTWTTVFGGSGFLGRRIVDHLLARGHAVRVASRRPERIRAWLRPDQPVEPVRADVRDEESVAAALKDARAAVNAVGLYVERSDASFHAIHVDGARRIAVAARRAGAEGLVHISGIGSDSGSRSGYVRARGQGEAAVRAAFDHATILRPSVMFGRDDALLTTLVALVRRFPVLPLFGRGRTRLQPVFVGDVAAAAAQALSEPGGAERVYELGGPDVLTYRELLGLVMRATGRRRVLLPVPFLVWDGLAAAGRALPNPPLTEGQVALMKRDNVASPQVPGLHDLNVVPSAITGMLERVVARH